MLRNWFFVKEYKDINYFQIYENNTHCRRNALSFERLSIKTLSSKIRRIPLLVRVAGIANKSLGKIRKNSYETKKKKFFFQYLLGYFVNEKAETIIILSHPITGDSGLCIEKNSNFFFDIFLGKWAPNYSRKFINIIRDPIGIFDNPNESPCTGFIFQITRVHHEPF